MERGTHKALDAAAGWRRDAIHYPARPLHPLDISFMVDTVGPGTEPGFDEWSLPVSRSESIAVDGWVFTRVKPFGDPPKALLKFPSLSHLWRIIPPLRRRILGFDRFLAKGGFEEQIATWDEAWRPEAERRIAQLRSADVSTAGREEVAAQLVAWHDFMTWQWSPHIRIHLVCFFVRGKFAEVCRRVLGLGPLDAYELIKRSDPLLMEQPRKLAAIARRASEDAQIREALEQPSADALQTLRGTWFMDAIGAFIDAYGDVPVDGFETALPTWREEPHRVVGLVQQMLHARYDPDTEEAGFQERRRTEIQELRARLAGDDLAEFDHWLALGERAYPLNDTHNTLLLELPVGLIRYTVLRAGELLASDGLLDDPKDAFFLRLDELTSTLRDGGVVTSLVRSRAQEMARVAAMEPPDVVGEPLAPATHVMPPRVAEALRILIEQADEMYGDKPGDVMGPAQSPVTGVAGSPGVAEGPVCVVTGVTELDKVREGDVLVCPITGPAWTAVFPLISGLVTESGGPLSHPAIVAREFGIPSVVGTRNATRVLQDGQRVRVDGTNAVVELLGAS